MASLQSHIIAETTLDWPISQMSAKVILLDHLLAHYGPETKQVRDVLRSAVS